MSIESAFGLWLTWLSEYFKAIEMFTEKRRVLFVSPALHSSVQSLIHADVFLIK